MENVISLLTLSGIMFCYIGTGIFCGKTGMIGETGKKNLTDLVDSLVTGVSVMLAGMPAGATTAVLAAKYNGDEKYASACICLSTVLSLVTIPAVCLFI